MPGTENSTPTCAASHDSPKVSWAAHGFSMLDTKSIDTKSIDAKSIDTKSIDDHILESSHNSTREYLSSFPKQQQDQASLDGFKQDDHLEASHGGSVSGGSDDEGLAVSDGSNEGSSDGFEDTAASSDVSGCPDKSSECADSDDTSTVASLEKEYGAEILARMAFDTSKCRCGWDSPPCSAVLCFRKPATAEVLSKYSNKGLSCAYERPLRISGWQKLPNELKEPTVKYLIDDANPRSNDLPPFLEYAGDVETQIIALDLYNQRIASMKKDRNDLIADDLILRSANDPDSLQPHFFAADIVDDWTREPKPAVLCDKVGKKWLKLNEEMRCLGEQRNQLHEMVCIKVRLRRSRGLTRLSGQETPTSGPCLVGDVRHHDCHSR